MELPKNITQIGEVNQSCRIYIEDYVFSYINQLNAGAADKETAVALYGTRKAEDGVVYFFLYGACKVNFLPKETRHLSQAVLQDADKQRKKFFPPYSFWGYLLLNGELIEGVYIYEQGVGRYVPGFARFYEQNDSMLNLLLAEKNHQKPEEVPLDKYEMVRRRQEKRRELAREQTEYLAEREKRRNVDTHRADAGREAHGKRGDTSANSAGGIKWAVTAAAVGLVAFLAWRNDIGPDNIRQTAADVWEELSSKQLPDTGQAAGDDKTAGTIVAEGKLADAVLKENEQQAVWSGQIAIASTESGREGDALSQTEIAKQPIVPQTPADTTESLLPPTTETIPQPTPEATHGAVPETTPQPTIQPTPEATLGPAPETTPQPTIQPTPEATPQPTPEPVKYTVKKGDTLIAICISRYGSYSRLQEICQLNHITNPDDIKVGAKILLP